MDRWLNISEIIVSSSSSIKINEKECVQTANPISFKKENCLLNIQSDTSVNKKRMF